MKMPIGDSVAEEAEELVIEDEAPAKEELKTKFSIKRNQAIEDGVSAPKAIRLLEYDVEIWRWTESDCIAEGSGTDLKKCPKCGSEHRVFWKDYLERDRGTLYCQVKDCGAVLFDWSGTRHYHSAELFKEEPIR